MPKHHIETTVTAAADPASVWRTVADVTRWADWGPWDATTREQDGMPDPDGTGAIRVLRLGRYTSRERVTAFWPESHLDYELLSGLPVRNYRSRISLHPQADGSTAIHWASDFDATYPGTGRAIERKLGAFLRDVAQRLADEAVATSHQQPAHTVAA